ncbi:MAG: MerR family transcriptional regulator [Nannocystaceae bacterium]|nr:MerR family transcriptional regulator [Nannocystaceae bacterium]
MPATAPSSPSSEGMTIDALAQAAGTTSRNVRALQTRGLLPPPTVIGRVGYYGNAHLERLQLIARLQERGYSLAAIVDLFRAWDAERSVGELLGFERDLSPPQEVPIEVSLPELVARFGGLDEGSIARAIALELVIPIPRTPDDPADAPPRVRVPSPRLLDVGRALMEVGIPLSAALDRLERLRAVTAVMAQDLVAMFAEHIVQPWAAAGEPLSSLPELVDRIRRTKPLPLAAVEALLRQAIEREVERVMGSIVPRHEPGA